MATRAKASKGTKVQRGDGGGSEVFTTIGEVLSFSGPGEATEEIDVTSFDSTSKEFISNGLPDGGEVTFEVNFVGPDAQQQGLRTDLREGTLRNFKIILNDHTVSPTTFSFAAVVKGLEGPSAGQGEQYKMSITLKVSGQAAVSYAP
jgi:hypothetical protein